MKIKKLIKERAKTHGHFPDQAKTAQAIKDIIRATPNWPRISAAKKESLELIATKISRLGHGDPTLQDTWDDISGYSEIANN